MQFDCYSIEHCQSQWVVSVCGKKILTCRTKKTAFQAARRATVLLHQLVQPPHQSTRELSDSNDYFRLAGWARQRRRAGAGKG